jgi:hypothetical protein
MPRLSFLLAVLFLPRCAGVGQVERISDLSAQQLKQIRELQLYETDRAPELSPSRTFKQEYFST